MHLRVLLALGLCPMLARAADRPTIPPPTARERDAYIRRGRVWQETDVESKDLYNGPEGELTFAPDEEIRCTFVPKALAGWTEKFLCQLDDGRVFKVKYNEGDRYKEAVGEVLGTRLFWALGFYADKMLPVRVTCRNCPRRPWTYVNARVNRYNLDKDGLIRTLPPDAERGTYTFDLAVIEEPLDAAIIERRPEEGWTWSSLETVDPKLGGATRAEIDALKLLSAFVENADNSAQQNTLACPRAEIVTNDDGRTTCRRPILYVDDLGAVFGEGGFTSRYAGRVDYLGWKSAPVWKSRHSRRAHLAAIGWGIKPSTMKDPIICEEGRALLAKQLERLSDRQIADLFRAARIDRLGQATVEDWVRLFKLKRDEILEHTGCAASRRAD